MEGRPWGVSVNKFTILLPVIFKLLSNFPQLLIPTTPLITKHSPAEPSTSSHNNRTNYDSINSRADNTRFERAKAISSDQFFDKDGASEGADSYRLNKFQGSAAISSDDYFDRPQQIPTGYSAVMNNASLADVKDYVKDTVKDTAERFSFYASSLMRRLNTDDF